MRPPPPAAPAPRPAPAPIIAPPPPVAKAAPPPAARKDVFGFGAPAAPAPAPSLAVEEQLEEDWSDLGQPAEPRLPHEPEMGLEMEPPPPPAPIELPEEPAGEPELAPMHAFVPPPEKVGHRPEASARAEDRGEAQLREALSKASLDVIERIVWEVVPQLAETIIRENLERLVKERQS